MTLGWIGLGQMGAPMANNLLRAGFRVNVYNRSPEKVEALRAVGATPLSSPAEVTKQSDIIFLMLSNAAAVEEVLTRDQGVLSGLQTGKVVIDMSTIGPGDSRSFSRQVAEKGGSYLDAPVSGSVGAAQAAQLVILAGGTEPATAAYRPCFEALGKKTLNFGAVGQGSAAKLVINLLLGITGQALGETMLFAEQSGLDKEVVMEMISQSGMNTGLFQTKKEMYRQREFPSQFMLELMAKDLGLIAAEVARQNLDLPLAGLTHRTYLEAKEHGKGRLDMAAIYLELQEKNR